MKRFTATALALIMTACLLEAKEGEGQEVNETASLTHELMRFAGNMHQFNSIFPQEKVYIQFDNTSYYTGETIWFKAFVVNASTLKRPQSKVLYVDLISPTGELLKRQKLKIVAGQADGSFALNDASTEQAREKRGVLEYPSGFYEVRAYTNYMLNFNEGTLFSRVFAVYEKPQRSGNYYSEYPTIKNRLSDLYEIRPKTEKLRKINCEFFPEGGQLVFGKPSRVAFKVTDETGFGVEASGKLDDTDITFSTVHDGMGWFTFTPSDRRNAVTITVDGHSKSFKLPKSEVRGLVMQADVLGHESIMLHVDCTPDMTGEMLGVALTCRGELYGFQTMETASRPVELSLSMAGVPEGVCRIYLFGVDGNIYASRSVYHHNDRFSAPSIEVYADKDKYEPFEKVALNFKLRDGLGNPFRDRFCLSVRDVRGQGNILADDLRTSLLLSSDLKGFIEEPSWYFDSDAPEHDTALDLLMLVQGWERYDWQTMTGQKEFAEKHRLEESLTVNGWIMNSSGRKPLENINVQASLMPNDKTLSEVYSYKTDSSGYFGFDLGLDFYDKARFYIRALPKRKRLIGPDARIVFDRSLFPSIRAYKPQELVFTGLGSDFRKRRGKNTDAEDAKLLEALKKDDQIILPEVEIEEDRIYVDYFTFKAYDVAKDVEIELDHGEYSTDLMGYLLDKGYSVSVNVNLTGYVIVEQINGFKPYFYIHNNERVVTPGTPDDPRGFFDDPIIIDSEHIKSILVYDRPMFFSNIIQICPLIMENQDRTINYVNMNSLYERYLLVDVLVKDWDELATRDEIFNINKRRTTIDGFSRPFAFYSPEYPDGPIPGDVDYRRTLYWNPNIVTDSIGNANVEFYNSSITTHFNVSAAGITASGVPYILNQNW